MNKTIITGATVGADATEALRESKNPDQVEV
jgi:hypothetical protein